MRGFLAGDVTGLLCGLMCLLGVDWLKTGLNRCKIGHFGGWYARYCELTVYKKVIFSFGFLLKSCNLGGLFVFRGPISWWRPDTYQMPGTKGRAGVSKKKEILFIGQSVNVCLLTYSHSQTSVLPFP